MNRLVRITMIVMALLTVSVACAQKTTRPKLKLKDEHVVAQYDTVVPRAGEVVISGYDKSQNSTIESFFVTNNTGSAIDIVNVTLTYYTLSGEQMHRATHDVNIYLDQDETRNVSIKSWDKQHLWYYHRTLAKHNDRCTPFDVRATVNYYLRK